MHISKNFDDNLTDVAEAKVIENSVNLEDPALVSSETPYSKFQKHLKDEKETKNSTWQDSPLTQKVEYALNKKNYSFEENIDSQISQKKTTKPNVFQNLQVLKLS